MVTLQGAVASHATLHGPSSASEAPNTPREWDDLDVAIVGGGPAGLAVALALLHARPCTRLKVFEASPAYVEQGAGVVVSLNGARALEAIDPTIIHRILPNANFISAMYDYNDETGERMPWVMGGTARENLEKHGYASCLTAWNSLRIALYSALPEGMVEFGCKVLGCDAPPSDPESTGAGGAGCYTLSILRTDQEGAAGSAHARARHVIAADGYFSRMRRTAGDGSAPAFVGMVRWLGSVTEAELVAGRVPLPTGVDPAALTAVHKWIPTSVENPPKGPAPRGLMLFGAGSAPGEGARLVWSLWAPLEALTGAGEAFPMPLGQPGQAGPTGDAAANAESASVHSTKRCGAEALRRALAATPYLPPDVRSMLAATPAERVLEFGQYLHGEDTFRQGAWASGRLLHVGDAAHTGWPDGQGFNQALEDAAVLGECVRAHGLGDKAFSAWEAARMQRVRDIMHDRTPDASRRMPRILASAFAPLWCPLQLAAPGGPLPPQVAEEAVAAVARGGEEEGRKVVVAWSRGEVVRLSEAKLAGCVFPQTVPAPAGMYRFR